MSHPHRTGLPAIFAGLAPHCSATRVTPRETSVSPWIDPMSERKDEAPALPFVPFAFKDTQEMQAMLASRGSRGNRHRHKPPLALAMVGLLSSTSALLATSPAGESALAASVPVIRHCVIGLETAMVDSVARERGLRDLGPNLAVER